MEKEDCFDNMIDEYEKKYPLYHYLYVPISLIYMPWLIIYTANGNGFGNGLVYSYHKNMFLNFIGSILLNNFSFTMTTYLLLGLFGKLIKDFYNRTSVGNKIRFKKYVGFAYFIYCETLYMLYGFIMSMNIMLLLFFFIIDIAKTK